MLVLSSRAFAVGLAQMIVEGRLETPRNARTPLEAAEQAMADFVTRIARATTRRKRRSRG